MADEGLLIPIQFTLDEARAALAQLEAQARAAGQRTGSGISDGMGKGLTGIKAQLGPARESMMFFTSALGEFGPAGQKAQTALTGIGGALMSATPALAGAALGMSAFRLVTGAISDSMEQADAKVRATTESLKALLEASRAAMMSEAARLATASGNDRFDLAQRLLAVSREESAARKDLAEATWVWQSNAAQQRLEEAKAARQSILLTAQETAAIKQKNTAIEYGRISNAAAWALQEQEAARLTAAEEKRNAAREKRAADNAAASAFFWGLEVEYASRTFALITQAEEVGLSERQKAELDYQRTMATLREGDTAAQEAALRIRNARLGAIDQQHYDSDYERFYAHLNRKARAYEAKLEKEKAIEKEHADFLTGSARGLASDFARAFTPMLTQSAAYSRAMKAAGVATANTADLSAAAFASILQNAMSAMATEALGRSLFETAAGFASWAWYDWDAAKNHFAAAAFYGSVAAMGGAGAYAIGQTRGMTKAERASVEDAKKAQDGGGYNVGGAREYGGGAGTGGTVTVRETIYVGVVANDFESPAETARRAARVMALAEQLDLTRRADA